MIFESVPLSEVADILMGYPFESEQYNNNGLGIRLARGMNIGSGNFNWDENSRWWNNLSDDLHSYYLQEGDIVIGMDGSRVGKNYAQVCKEDLPLLLVQRVACIRAKPGISQDFLWACIASKNFEAYIDLIKTGTTIPHISGKQIGEYPIPLVSEDEQQFIGRVSAALIRKIRLNTQINANLIERINTMFNNWMYAHSSISKDSSDSNSWHIGSIYEFLKITYGAPFSSNLFNSESRGCPLIRIRDLKTNLPQIYTDENHPKQTVVSPGDILVGMDAEFKPYVWLGKTGVLNQRIAKIDSILDGVCDYLIMLLIRPELEFIESYKTGTTVSHIGKEDFDQMKVVVPSCEDMISFSSTIKPMYDLIVELGEEKMILEELRDTLLPRLISGEIDVSNLPLPD
ncbi:restriction endonuclease subunit S [Methanomethylophilus alvi]|uniref:restriction endonuclease subunit S n=1 Tax=Methanomethylophilus alvi TaxID=1291540 RepID=UPI0037DD0ED1